MKEELIRQGLAWVFTRYCDRPICQGWKALEGEARKAKRGLWSMPQPVAPWEFRKGTGEGGVTKVADVHQPLLLVVHWAPRELSERPQLNSHTVFLGVCVVTIPPHFQRLSEANSLSPPVVLAIRFVLSFIVAYASMAWFMARVRRRGFVPFAVYRIVLGIVVLMLAKRLGG